MKIFFFFAFQIYTKLTFIKSQKKEKRYLGNFGQVSMVRTGMRVVSGIEIVFRICHSNK
jgi:hypothetical protein